MIRKQGSNSPKRTELRLGGADSDKRVVPSSPRRTDLCFGKELRLRVHSYALAKRCQAGNIK